MVVVVEQAVVVVPELHTQNLLIQIRMRQIFFYSAWSLGHMGHMGHMGHKSMKKSASTKHIYYFELKKVYEESKKNDEIRFLTFY